MVCLDPEKLLLDLSNGKELDAADLETIVQSLTAVDKSSQDSSLGYPLGRGASVDDLYAYLIVLQRAGLRQYQHLVERFLDTEDSLTAALALEILCLEWGLVEDYLERVVSFALGVPWDSDQDVQQAALKILGEYLRNAMSGESEKSKLSPRQEHVLSLLLNICDDAQSEHWTRQAAYFALCRAFGKEWEECPAECAQIDFSADSLNLDRQMLEKLRGLFA